MIAVFSLALGVVAGYLPGGQIGRLGGIHLKHEIPLVVAFGIQGFARGRLLGSTPSSWGMSVWVATSLVLAILLLCNVDFAGLRVAALGVALNLVVVLANMGMPVVSSVKHAGHAIEESAGFYHLAGVGTVAGWAGDVLPFGLPGQQFLLSAGDILLMVGVATLIADAMLRDGTVVDVSTDSGGKSINLRGQSD